MAEGVITYSKFEEDLKLDEVKKVLDAEYELDGKLERLGVGKLNAVFSFDGKEKAIIKVFNKEKGLERILFEENIIDLFISNNLPTARIIKNKQKGNHTKIRDTYMAAFEYIEGIKYSNTDKEKESCAVTQRRMHDALDKIPVDKASFLDSFESYLDKGIEDVCKKNMDIGVILKNQFEEVKEMFDAKTYTSLKKQIIHADYHPWNVLFDEKKLVKGIFDFDFVQVGPSVYGLAISQVYFSREPDGWLNDANIGKNIKNYVGWYQKEKKMGEKEKKMIIPMISVRLVDNLVRDILRNSSDELTFSDKRNLKFLGWILKNKNLKF